MFGSITHLNDRDKFANEDQSHCNAEKHIAVRTGLGEVMIQAFCFTIISTNIFTLFRIVFSIELLVFTEKKKALKSHDFKAFQWRGQKDSNSRHAVLETAARPTELYPRIRLSEKAEDRWARSSAASPFGGPSGTRTRDRPVMSRWL